MPQIKHAVFLKFKSTTTQAKIDEIFAALAGLKGKVPGLLDFTGGPYTSDEGLNKGFTHGLVMTFADAASRDGYLPHPDHEVVKEIVVGELDGGLDAVIAVDWEHNPEA